MVPTIIGIIFAVVFVGSILGGIGESMKEESERELRASGTEPTAMKTGFLMASKGIGLIITLLVIGAIVIVGGAAAFALWYVFVFLAGAIGVCAVLYLIAKIFLRK